MFKVKVLNLVADSSNTIQEGTRLTHVNQQTTEQRQVFSGKADYCNPYKKTEEIILSHVKKIYIYPFFIVLCITSTLIFFSLRRIKSEGGEVLPWLGLQSYPEQNGNH